MTEPEKKVHVHVYHGGGSAVCECRCPDGPCAHIWGGYRELDEGRGATVVCSRCGMDAMTHDMRVGP